MSSHVVVLDSTARRATVKTTPGKHLTDILQEACTKLGVDPSQHGLKYKGKELDMSLVFRLSGLTSGAKLELVQSSRSPSVVTVALQLPESEARGAPNGRLMDKFPSTTTIWFILRKFEAGVAGGATTRNLTGRGVPSGNEGAGRLYYETPVVQVLQRELSSLTDFQKSLAQLGFNSGNVLLRLSFRRTEEPLEEAMVKIQEYFQSSEDIVPKQEELPASTEKPLENGIPEQRDPEPETESANTSTAVSVPEQPAPPAPQSTITSAGPSEVPAGFSRPVTVFSPPSGDTPQSAQTTYNEADYIPSVDHAQAHQRRLNAASRPQRLPTDAEIAAKAAAEQEKLAAVTEVEVKVRLPDQSQVVAKFGRQDTGRALYDFVRNCLAAPFAGAERFTITYLPLGSVGSRGGGGGSGRKIQEVIPDSEQTLLIRDLGLAGRVLVNFSWDESASPAAHAGRELLKPELRTRAQVIKVEQPPEVMDTAENVRSRTLGATSNESKTGEKRKPGGIPKWLKLPGKK
ncbi:putative UBX domain protein [Aspergillus homomorphus CBS 101889]|uniref:Putative UBX domain protein n=1 Tax=Aspergillus homomorphus (strain CBS 101889) TaxID=1450537 RepID=A0A395HRX1_ASPHC|nr:putative UBX domain protein [Aspergillus homomorphus CBS 101889]RAL08994.1 putative UBX domain protein [Aspergillus homomorphus CBS 101889]